MQAPNLNTLLTSTQYEKISIYYIYLHTFCESHSLKQVLYTFSPSLIKLFLNPTYEITNIFPNFSKYYVCIGSN